MKKRVLSRIAGLVALYCAVFIALVMIQFTRKGNFTRRIGAMTVSGQYDPDAAQGAAQGAESEAGGKADAADNPALPVRGAGVYFGGLEFSLRGGESNDGFALVGAQDRRTQVSAETVTMSRDGARFGLSGGTELLFETHGEGESSELRISARYASGVTGIDIPVKLQRASVLRESGGEQTGILHNKTAYQFSRSVRLEENGLLYLQAGSPALAYRAVPQQRTFDPEAFVIANSRGAQYLNDTVTRWRDQSFSYWNRIISGTADEDVVIAYCGEAVRRGNYKTAAASVPPEFLRRSHNSSVYIGGMNNALRTFTRAEDEKIDRITRLIREESPDILRESHVFEFLLIRGLVNLVEDGIDAVRAVEGGALTLEMCPGVFESYSDLSRWRPYGDNPFERIADQACGVLAGGIRRDAERDMALVFRGDTADIEYNLRLGNALAVWAEAAGRDDWAAVGRSLTLSVFQLRDNAGVLPVSVSLSESGGFTGAGSGAISAARMYRIITPGEYYPRAVGIGSGVNGLWAWTAASAVDAVQENNILDISVSFPAGETHHLMIRGIRPFTKIQIYNLDYPTDPQFERYDSSGWVYSAEDQILVLKLKHRADIEHVRIFY